MKPYRIRYSVEAGKWKPGPACKTNVPAVRVSKTDYGYADELFIVSMVANTYLMLSTEGPPSRETLLAVRKAIDQAIDHQLEHHTEKS